MNNRVQVDNARKVIVAFSKTSEMVDNVIISDVYVANVSEVYTNESPQVRILYHLKGERFKVLMSQFEFFNLLYKYESLS